MIVALLSSAGKCFGFLLIDTIFWIQLNSFFFKPLFGFSFSFAVHEVGEFFLAQQPILKGTNPSIMIPMIKIGLT